MKNILKKPTKNKIVLTAIIIICASTANALETKPVLSLEVAQKMANACIAHQQENGYKPINIAIVDDGGNNILINRQDGACKACDLIAINKARTAALFNNPTRVFETVSHGPELNGEGAKEPGLAHVPGLITFPGGLPIRVGDTPIGGIGVSGASGGEDEQCAAAAIKAVDTLLK